MGMGGKKWSVGRAAQLARTMRTETAEHLRTAPIAREWRKAKVVRAYEIHSRNLGSRDAAKALLYGGLGHRPPYPASWDDAATVLIGDEARYLADAQLYVISPQMCDVVIAAAQSLTAEDLKLLDKED